MNRIPLVLLTGFLGSGKTTMLNSLLATQDFRDTALVINEAGDVGLDHLLVEQGTETIVMLEGGCMCCRAKGALSPALVALLRRARDEGLPPFKRVVVETSGLSDPAAILEGLITDVFFNRNFAFAGIVTTVDARAFAMTVADHVEARMQVALADRLLLTKTDLVTSGETIALQNSLSAINPHAEQRVVPKGEATAAMFWPEILDLPRAFTETTGAVGASESPEIATASLVFAGTLPSDVLEAWLDHTIGLLGPMLLRMKAMLDIENAAGPTVLHAVRGLLHQPTDLKAWPTADRQNRVVLIGCDVEQQILMDCLARLASAAMPAAPRRAAR